MSTNVLRPAYFHNSVCVTFVISLLGWLAAAPSLHAAAAVATPKQAVVAVNGMACPFCAYGIKKHLMKLPGAKRVEVELAKGQAIVHFAAGVHTADTQIEKAVRDAGFSPGRIEWRSDAKHDTPSRDPKQ